MRKNVVQGCEKFIRKTYEVCKAVEVSACRVKNETGVSLLRNS